VGIHCCAGSGLPVTNRRLLFEANGAEEGNFIAPPRRGWDKIIHYKRYDMNRYRDEHAIARFVQTLTLQGVYGRKGAGNETKS
jgi:hypothetical protein